VGHTLGLRHNHKASSAYTVAQLRDPAFTEKNGNEASIMDYGRFNYVAQPGDGARLIPRIGPYDRFAIEWGYRPLPNARTPEDEKEELDRIAARQVTDPTLRFGGEDMPSTSDPTVQTEDLGSDPIEATTLGLKNIDRVAAMLLPAATKFGEDYDRLRETFNFMMGQRLDELMHVAKLIGGVVETRYHAGRGKETFVPVPKPKQVEAMRFLLANAFIAPKHLLRPEILQRIQPGGSTDSVMGEQGYLLRSLLDERRIGRMLDHEAMAPGKAYTVAEMVSDLQRGIWSELAQPQPAVDVYRRSLQRTYLQLLKTRVNGDAIASEMRAVGRGALVDLAALIDRSLPKVKDRATALHLRSARSEIGQILNPTGAPSHAAPSVSFSAPEVTWKIQVPDF
jgi:hypothetical protein